MVSIVRLVLLECYRIIIPTLDKGIRVFKKKKYPKDTSTMLWTRMETRVDGSPTIPSPLWSLKSKVVCISTNNVSCLLKFSIEPVWNKNTTFFITMQELGSDHLALVSEFAFTCNEETADSTGEGALVSQDSLL